LQLSTSQWHYDIPNPIYVPEPAPNAAPSLNVPRYIPNPGVELGHGHQKRLQMLGFWCNYIDWTNRTWVLNQATIANLTGLYNFKQELVGQSKDAEVPREICRSS
jgi:hypothetical protein